MVKHINNRKITALVPVFFLLSFFISQYTDAQNSVKSSAKGKAIDSASAAPLGYASVRIFNGSDNKLVNGTLATDSGDFSIELPYGSYYAEVEFMGYNPCKTNIFSLSKDKPTYDFGTIKLLYAASTLSEVLVQAEKSSMQLTLDKKIFNVGKDLANAGGSASDILTQYTFRSGRP